MLLPSAEIPANWASPSWSCLCFEGRQIVVEYAMDVIYVQHYKASSAELELLIYVQPWKVYPSSGT